SDVSPHAASMTVRQSQQMRVTRIGVREAFIREAFIREAFIREAFIREAFIRTPPLSPLHCERTAHLSACSATLSAVALGGGSRRWQSRSNPAPFLDGWRMSLAHSRRLLHIGPAARDWAQAIGSTFLAG